MSDLLSTINDPADLRRLGEKLEWLRLRLAAMS